MKKKYLISALGLAAALMLSGCGGDKKETETSAQEKQTAAGTEASSDISGSTGETADDTDTADIVSEETETETEATIAPITPSDYLVKDASKYVTLGNYDGLEIVQYTYDVTDDMVQQQIDMDLQSAGTEEDIDTPSASGDIIYVSLKAVAEDADSENTSEATTEAALESSSETTTEAALESSSEATTEAASKSSSEVSTEAASENTSDLLSADDTSDESDDAENTYFTIGNEEYGADFDKELIGLSTGDTKQFSVTFSDDDWVNEDWIGHTVDFTVTVNGVTRVTVPEYNDDFITNYTDYSSKEEYEAAVRKNLEDQYTDISYSDAIESLFQAALDATTFNGYPQDLYDTCKEESISFYRMFAGDDGTSDADILAAFGISEEDIDSEVLTAVNQRLLISAYCEANNITLTEEDYLNYLENNAADYGEESAASFEEDYGRDSLVWSLYQSKVADLLYNSAKITKTSYSDDLFSDDLSDLQFSTESDTEAASDAETSETLAEGDDLSMELETFSSEDVVDLSESSATE